MALFVPGVLCNCAKHNSGETVQRASDGAQAFILHQPNLPISENLSVSDVKMSRNNDETDFHCARESLHGISEAA